ncbi:MAG: alpha/beta hydrolase [Chloroflexi bacterium]|nr:alpha/beta hydrolase [Chloroflexota bacterium]
MDVTIGGARLFYLPVGPEQNYPLIVLHGGPGLDHTEMHPWLDPLSDTFRLLYLDLRGHGRSERVDPASLTLDRYAEDVSELAAVLGLRHYALLGHSYGAFITLAHAVERGDASHYIISSGSASMSKSMPEIQENLARFEPAELREQVMQSWAREPEVRTREEAAEILRMQMPFHFASVESEAYRKYVELEDRCIYTPEILAYTASHEYAIEFEDRLSGVTKPVLILAGERDRTTTARAARDMHAGIPGSELVIIPDAGHMAYVEQPEIYFTAVREFFAGHPYSPSGGAPKDGLKA